MAAPMLTMLWMSLSGIIAFSGTVYIFFGSVNPLFDDLLLYGKVRKSKRPWTFIRKLEVPKSWFKYFYVVGILCNLFYAYVAASTYFFAQKPPEMFVNLLQYLRDDVASTTGAGATLLLICMMLFQTTRRAMECFFVSSYSHGTINILHFLMGIFLYSTFGLIVLCEAPSIQHIKALNLAKELDSPMNILGLAIFWIASYQQYKCHRILADLRKNSSGKNISVAHHIPQGGLFNLVSCPHYLMECVIYMSFIIVAGFDNNAVFVVGCFVFTNQIVSAVITHDWYLKHFGKKYPSNRNALIPYIL